MSDSASAAVETPAPESEPLPTGAREVWYRKRWVIGAVGFAVGALVVAGAYQAKIASLTTKLAAETHQVDSGLIENSQLTAKLAEANASISQLENAASTESQNAPAQTPAASPAPSAPSPTTVSDGTYLVGTDIPAGRYKGAVTGDNGYWQVSRDANGSNILSNGNPTGQFYVQVKKGQYLEIGDATITKVK